MAERANLSQISTLMLRGFERRLSSPSTTLDALATRMTLKDGKTDEITNFIPMAYSDNSAEKDLSFPTAKDVHEDDMDRNEYNLTFRTYRRDPSKIGGEAIFRQDYRTGMFGGAAIQEQIAYYIMDKIVHNTSVSSGTAITLKDTSETNYTVPIDNLSLYAAHQIRVRLRLPMDMRIKCIVPFDIFPLLTDRFQARETGLGDRAFDGMIFDSVNNVQYVGEVGSPVTFKIAVGSQPAVGDTLRLVNFSNYATIKFIAADTTTVPAPGEVKLGSSASATRTNIIDYLTDQTTGEPTATSKYGVRIQYDLHADDPDPRNLQRQEARFVKAPTGETSYDLIMYGSMGRLDPVSLTSAGAVSNKITFTDIKGLVLYVADGGAARYKIYDDLMYQEQPTEKNLQRMNHQVSGTFGAQLTFGNAARFEKVSISYSDALATRLGRTNT